MVKHLWAIHHHCFPRSAKITPTLFKRYPQARSNLMRWPLLHNFLQSRTQRYSFATFIIIDQFDRLLSNMPGRRLTWMDGCEEKLFPHCIFSRSFCLWQWKAILWSSVFWPPWQSSRHWVNESFAWNAMSIRRLVPPWHVQEGEVLSSSSGLTLG